MSEEGSHIMDITTIKTVFFSPTETTARIVNGIAQGIGPDIVGRIDLTLPGVKRREVEQMRDELTIIGTPVYAGRVPAEAVRRVQLVKGDNSPAVVVVVYGNREYEDALLELREIVAELGFRPIAGGAFIGGTRTAARRLRLLRAGQTVKIWKKPSDSVSRSMKK
jgi:hypothetical protein